MCCEHKHTPVLVLVLVQPTVQCAMCDPLVLVLPTGQMCIDDLANGCSHHYQSTKASTGLLIIIHTSSPQLSLSPSPIWSACPITNHSDFHQNFSQCSQLFQVCFSLRECPLLLISLALVVFSRPKALPFTPHKCPTNLLYGCEQILVKSTLQI